MSSKRILSAAAAAAIFISCFSCTMNDDKPRIVRERDRDKEFRIGQEGVSDTFDSEQIPSDVSELFPERVGTDFVTSCVEDLLNDLETSAGRTEIKSDIQLLLDTYDEIYDAHTEAEIVFYSHYKDKDFENAYNLYHHDFNVSHDIISYGFYCGLTSDCSDLFDGLVDDEMIELYSDGSYTLSDAVAEAESSFLDSIETLSEYYDTVNDTYLSDEEKNIKCAELLLELLEDYTPETFYSQYDRDYTGDDILALGKSTKDDIISAYEALYEAYFSTQPYMYDEPEYDLSDPFMTICRFTPALSPDIEKYAEKLISEELYTICSEPDAFEGSFMDDLPTKNSARIFIGSSYGENCLHSAIHEFGHFYASFYDTTPSFLSKANLDIAEIQSQGFELLFMQFYDDIYKDGSSSEKIYQLISMLDSVVSGFMVGEFEYRVVSELGDITPEEVVELFNTVHNEYYGSFTEEGEVLFDLYSISHIFESPGYYISYATSALASLSLTDDVMRDPRAALEKYEKIAHISSYSGEYSFRGALKECGFDDVLTEKYITGLSEKLIGYASELSDTKKGMNAHV